MLCIIIIIGLAQNQKLRSVDLLYKNFILVLHFDLAMFVREWSRKSILCCLGIYTVFIIVIRMPLLLRS